MITPTIAVVCSILKFTNPIVVPVPVEQIPAFTRPMIVINKPIPTETAFFKHSGIDLIIASRTPKIERRIKIRPSTKTAVRANCHVHHIPRTTEYVKKALSPRPGARATGRVARKAITKVATAAEIAVAVNTALNSIPESERIPGFTAKI